VNPALPLTLRNGIERLIQNVAPAKLARGAESLSDVYRGDGASDRAVKDDADLAAYLAVRLPATYAAMSAALASAAAAAPAFAPRTLLDAGAGPGTASWAAVEAWHGIQHVTMLDCHARFLDMARVLSRDSASVALRDAKIVAGDMAAIDAAYDVVLAGYVLSEIPSVTLERTVEALWRSSSGVLAIVEPGTPGGFARLLRVRAQLAALGARIVAPCPGSYACPVAAPDWCHFAVRLPRSRAHLRAKQARMPFEDEKFSYLVVARDTVAVSAPSARILAEPHAGKTGVRLKLCSDGRIADRIVLKRDKVAYKSVAKAKWGDAV
jgi:ribosomal protein RSM22 (predicted rRNA methylase)